MQIYLIAGVILTTTVIAAFSVWFASGVNFQQRVLP